MSSPAASARARYDRIAGLYDLLAGAYSAGGIARAKKAHLPFLKAGSSALYIGAGTGEECVLAATKGVRVSLWDTSEHMLRLAKLRFEEAGQEACFEQVDALSDACDETSFDVVITPFFLNVLRPDEVKRAFSKLANKLRTGGLFVCVDFRRPVHGWFALFQRLHYQPPLWLFVLLTRNPVHELYDYDALVSETDAGLCLVQNVVSSAWGLPLYETLIWEKQG